ncbi:hypothetical protein [Candidatus Nitrosocosmicus hydrocola]|uniref:hypothetical protein n=1 Tax=Candidatus Nitrosocosmicus hydrocola TaxID=1826872 RepID=UPI0011E5A495|nr:hypothetical protein [Candidatus Nitrosocosmicus hydrocola]
MTGKPSSGGSRLHFNIFNNLRSQFIEYVISLYDKDHQIIKKITFAMYGCEGTFEHDTNKAVCKIEISIETENV